MYHIFGHSTNAIGAEAAVATRVGNSGYPVVSRRPWVESAAGTHIRPVPLGLEAIFPTQYLMGESFVLADPDERPLRLTQWTTLPERSGAKWRLSRPVPPVT